MQAGRLDYCSLSWLLPVCYVNRVCVCVCVCVCEWAFQPELHSTQKATTLPGAVTGISCGLCPPYDHAPSIFLFLVCVRLGGCTWHRWNIFGAV